MKVLVFGARGQVGRALAAAAPSFAEMVSVDREACELSEPAQVSSIILKTKPDIVINAAAYTAVDRAESEPEIAHAVNAVAPGVMAEAARRVGGRLIHISTDFVFGGQGSCSPYKVHDRPSPEGVYAQSKCAGERRVIEDGPDHLVVRTAWVYSPHGSNFVRTMLRLMCERDVVSVVADQIGTPTSASSLARAIWVLAERGATGLHHFTDAGVASWYDFACAVAEEATSIGLLERSVRVAPIATADYPTPARRPAYSVLDKGETWMLLGQVAPHWRVTLRDTLQEIKNG
jgi:dTDP-4-dehydrorhamnose reductase